MKNIFVCVGIAGLLITACNNNEPSKETAKSDTAKATAQATPTEEKSLVSISEVLTDYLDLKNALANDNANDAGEAAKKLNASWKKINGSSLAAEQKKVYDDVNEDIEEHSEHIGANADKIEHQREHFDWLSSAVYEVVKAFKPGQILYKDHCPMYNDGKGAIWVSEIKEIKNPYLGKKMPTCGSIKEEMK